MDPKHEKHGIEDDNSSQTGASPERKGAVYNERASTTDKALALEAQREIDPAMDKRLTRLFDLHIIPWLFGIWYALGGD